MTPQAVLSFLATGICGATAKLGNPTRRFTPVRKRPLLLKIDEAPPFFSVLEADEFKFVDHQYPKPLFWFPGLRTNCEC